MRRPSISPATVLAGFALFVALGGTSVASNGAALILGQANDATTKTALTAKLNGPALQLSNTKPTAAATALDLKVASGNSPFTTNGTGKVVNLNADLLDGIDSTGFYAAGSTVADSGMLEGHTYFDTIRDARPGVLLAASHKGVHQDFTATFHVPDDGATIMSTLYASAYSPVVTAGISLCAYASRGIPGETFQLGCAAAAVNEVNSHKTLVSMPHVMDMPGGDWTVSLSAVGAITNNDDRESLVIQLVS